MSAILRGEISTAHVGDRPEVQAAGTGARTLLAFAVATSLLLAVILGLWSMEPSNAGCAVGSATCERPAPLVPAGPR
jgi:hypothetical protein